MLNVDCTVEDIGGSVTGYIDRVFCISVWWSISKFKLLQVKDGHACANGGCEYVDSLIDAGGTDNLSAEDFAFRTCEEKLDVQVLCTGIIPSVASWVNVEFFEVNVSCFKGLFGYAGHGNGDAAVSKIFRHFQTDVAGTDNNGFLRVVCGYKIVYGIGVGDVLKGKDSVVVDSGYGRYHRLGTRGKDELVVGFAVSVIRQTAISKRDVLAHFEHDDLGFFVETAEPCGSGCTACDSTNNQDFFHVRCPCV